VGSPDLWQREDLDNNRIHHGRRNSSTHGRWARHCCSPRKAYTARGRGLQIPTEGSRLHGLGRRRTVHTEVQWSYRHHPMAAAGSLDPVTDGTNRTGQAVRTGEQCRRDLHCTAGPLRHLRRGRQGLPTGVAPQSAHPFQDHATTVKRLAQIAYSDLPEMHRERYTYDAFVQFLNDLGLHHQLQARGVTTIEDALHEGGAYLLAKQPHRAHVSSQQITVEPGPDTPIQVAAATTISPLEAEVDRIATMLEKLVAVLARANPTEPTQRPLRPRVEAPRPTALCWECGECGHLRANYHRTDWTRPRPGDPGNLCHQSTRRGCYTRDAILETRRTPHRLQQVCHTDGRQGAHLSRQVWSSPSGRCAGSTELYDTRPLPGYNSPHRIVKGNLLAATALLRFAL